MIDDKDRAILNILQDNARVANTDIAGRVGLAPSAVLERVRKLEERGLIQGYHARINPKPVGRGLLAFVFVRTEEREESRTARRLAEIPEVQEVHNIAGEDCYLVKVRVSDPEALGRLLRDKVGTLPAVRSTRTTIVLETMKETSAVPIAVSEGKGGVGRKRVKGGKRS
ncbi:MAG: Lrp/AsnC family transcriptional regulator [Gemmatimonadetes bacterium]|nr:Lrp/AsnC family transcriptional regulator [Gemmatimonadota bacterium]